MNYAFLTGGAGSGKTYCVAQLIAQDWKWGILTATTGPAARNLAEKTGIRVKTFNAELHCGTLAVLREAFRTDALQKRIANIRSSGYKRIVIDEASMLLAESFSLIYRACLETRMGLVLVGDFLQLPPVGKDEPKPHWAFESKHWSDFTDHGANIIRLTENHRQGGDRAFTTFLNLLRAGRGVEAEAMLPYLDIHWNRTRYFIDENFLGMTLVRKNETVKKINDEAGKECTGAATHYRAEKFGEDAEDWDLEWDKKPESTLRVGNKVIILKNQYQGAGEMRELYCANGDVGKVVTLSRDEVTIALKNGRTVTVGYVQEDNSWWEEIVLRNGERTKRKHKATAGVRYMPLALAYAATVHKAQGLTLSSGVQVCTDLMLDSRGRPGAALLYVALSRCEKSSDVFLTGTTSLADVCSAAPEVAEWI